VAVDGIKRLSILGAVGVSVVFAAYNGWLSSQHLAPGGGVFFYHRLVVMALLATWIVVDAKERQRAKFDHGFNAFIFFFVYAPYYLISTRRGRGVLIFGGMVILFLLPQLAELFATPVS
jgi:hypothetical protein